MKQKNKKRKKGIRKKAKWIQEGRHQRRTWLHGGAVGVGGDLGSLVPELGIDRSRALKLTVQRPTSLNTNEKTPNKDH